VAKVNCQTCHQGVNKPYGGASMAKDYPELQRAKPLPAAADAAAEGAAATATEATTTAGDAGTVVPAQAAPVAAATASRDAGQG
jgi:photosynthetic reaction center cytochrome c subunit